MIDVENVDLETSTLCTINTQLVSTIIENRYKTLFM